MARLLLFITSFLSVVSFCTAVAVPRGVSCAQNPVVKVLSLLKASSFCSSYVHLTTETVSVTTTQATTLVVQSTSTAVVQDPLTSIGSATITSTTVQYTGAPGAVVTVPVTQTSTPPAVTSYITIPTTVTTTQTTTYFPGGPALAKREDALEDRGLKLPAELSSFAASAVSSACSCYVSAPTTTTTLTAPSTSTSTSVAVVTSTNSFYAATTTLDQYTTVVVDQTTTSPVVTVTSTTTVTAPAVTAMSIVASTTTVTATTTVTDSSPSFTAVLGPVNSSDFIGYNSASNQVDSFNLPSTLSIGAAYQSCAAACVAAGSKCASFEVELFPENWSCIVGNLPIGSYSAGDAIYVVDFTSVGSTEVAAYNVVHL